MLQRIPVFLLVLLLIAPGCSKKKEEQTIDPQESDVEALEEESAEDAVDEDADSAAQPGVERETQRWFIFEEKVACGNDDTQDCFRIRRASHPEWEVIDREIEGFEYEEGTRYILEVDVLTRTQRPADGNEADEGVETSDESAADGEKTAPQATVVGYELVRQVSPLLEGEEEPTCTSNDDCEEGEMCAGPAGCDIPWTCQPMRPCTRDLRQYCSCDGETIEGSGSCPPAPYKHPGPCK